MSRSLAEWLLAGANSQSAVPSKKVVISSCLFVSGSALVQVDYSSITAGMLPASSWVKTGPQWWPVVTLGMEERQRRGCSCLSPGCESRCWAHERREWLPGMLQLPLGNGCVNPGRRKRRRQTATFPCSRMESSLTCIFGQSNGYISILKYLDSW